MVNKIKRLVIFLFILGVVLAYVFHFDQYVTLTSFKEHRLLFRAYVDQHYLLAVFTYIFSYMFLVALSLPTGGLLTLLGGFLFGVFPGALYAAVGATSGASCAFLLTRYLIGNEIQERYWRYTKRMNAEIERYGHSYLLMLRLVAIVPFFIVNLVAGVTKVPFSTFFWTTAIGILPATTVIALAGQELATINTLSDIFSKRLMISFILLALLAVLPMIFHRLRRRRVI